MAGYVCPVRTCHRHLEANAFVAVLAHARSSHSSRDEFMCQLCDSTLGSFDSWRMHMLRYHGISGRRKLRDSNEDGSDVFGSDCIQQAQYYDCVSPDERTDPATSNVNDLQQFGGLYMKIREHYGLPIKVAHGIMQDFVKFNSSEPDRMGEDNINVTSRLDFQSFWHYFRKKENYRQFCLSNGLVEPTLVSLTNVTGINGTDNGDVVSNEYCYVPLLSNLRKYLSHKDVLSSVLEKTGTGGNEAPQLNDFSDGEYFKTSNFFMGDCSYLRIHLYIDELEVCNPLGSSRCKHKLTCIYYVVGNINERFLSCLRNINVLLIAKSSTIKSFGYDAVLEKSVADFLVLENEGIQIHSEGQIVCFKGGLATISGDNLGSHDIGGFRKSFSSGRICRFCMCCYKDLLVKTSESAFVMRTKEAHAMHVQACLTDSSLGNAYGVLTDSPFKTLSSYCVISGLPPDIMHDMLEGVIPITMRVIVGKIIESGLLSNAIVKNRITSFVYGKSDSKNFPRNITSLSSSMTASEAWCIFRQLPFMIGDLIPNENAVWDLYLLLASICDIVFTPKLQEEWIPYLDVLVTDFYADFKLISPENIKPKFHFMLHYPSHIKKFGPLRKLWCMRFEAYHQTIKRIIRRSKNFKNVCLTAAKRVQFLKCWERFGVNVLSEGTTFTCGEAMKYCDLPSHLRIELNGMFPDYSSEETLFMVSSLRHESRQYLISCVEIIEMRELPLFCVITNIFKFRDSWYLCGLKLSTSPFCRHLHSFCVTKTAGYHVFLAGLEKNVQHALDVYKLNFILCKASIWYF